MQKVMTCDVMQHLINLSQLVSECPGAFRERFSDSLMFSWYRSSLRRLSLLATNEYIKHVMRKMQSAINWSQLLSLFLGPRSPSELVWPEI